MLGKIFKWLFLAFIGLVALGWYVESSKTPEQKAAEAAERAERNRQSEEQKRAQAKLEMDSLPQYTARDIARAYNENTVAADQRFKGKKFKVSGTVGSINTDLFGRPYLTLRGGVNQFMEPQFSFSKGAADQLATLRAGSKVELICTGNGDVAKTPMNTDCVML